METCSLTLLFSDVDVIIFLYMCANRSLVTLTLCFHYNIVMMCHM